MSSTIIIVHLFYTLHSSPSAARKKEKIQNTSSPRPWKRKPKIHHVINFLLAAFLRFGDENYSILCASKNGEKLESKSDRELDAAIERDGEKRATHTRAESRSEWKISSKYLIKNN